MENASKNAGEMINKYVVSPASQTLQVLTVP